MTSLSQNNQCVPLVQEGMKWVNERVIINHGDTTFSYYTYEIKADDVPENYIISDANQTMACHYYNGTHLDIDNDSIISYLTQYDWIVGYSLNHVQSKVANENRNLLKLMRLMVGLGNDEFYMYYFYPMPEANIGQYLFFQIDPLFNDNNFFEIDPVEIDGATCQRLAHVNNQGDILFYVVEGIGFDSRDMGDLLSPFMRQPDPDADYQEYWGLSHVIKDGKIIYKGMRYNEDHLSAVGEVAADRQRAGDANYYNLMGQPMGKDVPTAPGIYIHQGKKIIVR